MTYETEEEFLANYNIHDYPAQAVAADLSIFTLQDGELCVLLIKRGGYPCRGQWALPGGFVEVTESVDEAAARELEEETGIAQLESGGGFLEQLKTYAYPGRDPRGYIVSVAYVALVPRVKAPVAGDDAAEAAFIPVRQVLSEDFTVAFDHKDIVRDGLDRVRAKLEYSPIAVHFLDGDTFTLSELQRVYEQVWGAEFKHPTNFRRKLTSVEDFLIPTGERRASRVPGGRSSELFRAGPAMSIYPPFRRLLEDS